MKRKTTADLRIEVEVILFDFFQALLQPQHLLQLQTALVGELCEGVIRQTGRATNRVKTRG